jgi:hypothetical protein
VNANVPQLVTIVTVYVRCGSSLRCGAERCGAAFGAGTFTVVHGDLAGAGAAAPVAAVLVGGVAEVAVLDELDAAPPPQPASPTTTARISHARRMAHKQTRSGYWELL